MKDVSYHILDIVQNSLQAGADAIDIGIFENSQKGEFILEISDNGCGMTEDVLRGAIDPFYTSSTTKKVGLGLPLLKQNAECTGGFFKISSVKNKGTKVTALFNSLHIDMIPVGNLALTLRTLIASNPEKNFIYRHYLNNKGFTFNTAELKQNLEGISLNTWEVLDYITVFINDNLKALRIFQSG